MKNNLTSKLEQEIQQYILWTISKAKAIVVQFFWPSNTNFKNTSVVRTMKF